ncbi:MAG: histidine phosphatase family protein [Oscillospiraceae bacterium]|nr:histidine phosphatase family protein [Oscillospiraceae bacterium]
MLFFYIRHGDPVYNPNQLTPLGERQAEAVAKRLSRYGIDKIYSSPSNRAVQTAKPTCEILKKEMSLLDFSDEALAYQEFTILQENGRKEWVFAAKEIRRLFLDESVRKLGLEWYNHPAFAGTRYKEGMERIGAASDKLFAELGYEHIPGSGSYKAVRPNNDRIALFAHGGFGRAFMSHLLDIPYPMFSTHFELAHTGMTVVEFRDEGGIAIPNVLTYGSDSHIYKEGLPTFHYNRIHF